MTSNNYCNITFYCNRPHVYSALSDSSETSDLSDAEDELKKTKTTSALSDGSETSDLLDTEDELKKTKTTSTLSDGLDLNNSDSEFDLDFSPYPKPWKNLKPELQSVLPEGEMYTYLVEYYQALPQHKFCGAPAANFEVHVRVNLDDETQVKDWVDTLSEKTKCTHNLGSSVLMNIQNAGKW